MTAEPKPKTRPLEGRRRFVAGTLGIVGGGTVLGALSGCQEPTTKLSQPPAPRRDYPPRSRVTAPGATAHTPVAPPLPDGKELKHFIKHGDNPLTLEARREFLGASVLTATRHMFVRQNLPLPPPSFVSDREGWKVEFEGLNHPKPLRVSDLKQLGLVTLATVLQCSGNGRKYYEHGPSGSEWGVGACGCAMWSGVPLRAVVEHLGGLAKGVRYMTTTGGEVLPAGIDRDKAVVERSIPIDKALDDCLLAWEMNGEPLPLSHGGPLRLIVPGYYGCNQIKFVKRVAFTREQGPAKIQQTGYRMRPIGVKGSADQPAMWAMNVKSFITLPTERTPRTKGTIQVTGVAFAGTQGVRAVEVSTDGNTWHEANFVGPDLGRYAWRVFNAQVQAEPGVLTLYSRATADDGTRQPATRHENERGYGNNAWRDMGVVVKVCEPGDSLCATPPAEVPNPAAPKKPRGPVVLSDAGKRGREVFRHRAAPSCATCHSLADAEATGQVGPRLDTLGRTFDQIRAAVENGVGVMPPFGQTLTPEQVNDVARYVFEVTQGG